jgi:hypothetical protein
MSEEGDDSVEDDDAGTTTEDYRWRWLSTAVVLSIVGSQTSVFVGTAYGVTEPITGGTWMVHNVAYLAAVAYALGPDIVREAQRMRNGEG